MSDPRTLNLFILLIFVACAVIYTVYVFIDMIADMLTEDIEFVNLSTGELEFSRLGVIKATVFNLIHYHFISLRWERTDA